MSLKGRLVPFLNKHTTYTTYEKEPYYDDGRRNDEHRFCR